MPPFFRLPPAALTALALALAASTTAEAAPNPDAVTMHRGQKARVAVLANDTGTLDPATVTIATGPQFGTAAPDSGGRILYTHTTGAPAADSFTYRVNVSGAPSAPVTVTITFATGLRIANAGLNVPATPPATTFQLTNAFGTLSVTQPVCLASPQGETLRLFACEKTGLVKMIPAGTTGTPTAVTFLSIPAVLSARQAITGITETISTSSEQGLLGLAFHPNYAVNRYFYVFYSVTKSGVVYERVSRFTTQTANANAADQNSELILLEQVDRADNHNGGDLHFGPDGYLYISFGDEGNQDDSFGNGQKINLNFFGGIARIDVDKKAGNLAPNAHPAVKTDAGVARYSIPADNPFVGATSFNGLTVAPSSVRTEWWAVGMRNPWRFSFDAPTGEMWVGDVGGGVWEEVNVVLKGKNHGWAYREGNQNGPRSSEAPANYNTLYHSPPLYAYAHGSGTFQGNSITGGLVYRGSRFASLQGAYIFADYGSGNIWTLRRTSGAPDVQRIAGEGGISAFGTDPSNGDVLLADINNNRILRLTTGAGADSFPTTLSATNLFSDLTDLSPAPGLLPYTVNLPFWSDFAVKKRWFAIPDGTSKMAWSRDGLWTFPSGTIWVKHFDLETTRGNPATKKRLETRLLVKTAAGSYGVSYQWNALQTEAMLVPDEGADFGVSVVENGVPRVQNWHIPSRAECSSCHNPQAGHALSFNTRQINLANVINGFSGNQIDLLSNGGFFSNTPESSNLLPRHVRPDEGAIASQEARVRSYIDVNCAYCHRAGGSAPSAWDGRVAITLDQTGLINGAASNNGGNALNKLIVPGDTAHSIVLNRVAVTNGFTRMPPLASSELDQAGIALLTAWINGELPARQTYAQWRLAQFGSATSPQGDPAFDADNDGRGNEGEWLAGTNPQSGSSLFPPPQLTVASSNMTLSFNVPVNRSFLIESSTDLVNWLPWNVPGNEGIPRPGGTVSISGSFTGARQFFRLRLSGN